MADSVVYTSIFGDYDSLINPKYSKEFDYVCFTDNPQLKSNIWEVQIIKPHIPNDSCRSARYVKINAHKFLPDFEYSMYVDGNMLIKDIPNIQDVLGDYKFAIEPHITRDCIYDEAIACKRLGKDDPVMIDLQMDVYKKMGFPEHAGLCGTGLHFKQHNDPEIIKRCELWWSQIALYSLRDQLSFPLIFHDYPIQYLSAEDRHRYIRITSVHPCPYRIET